MKKELIFISTIALASCGSGESSSNDQGGDVGSERSLYLGEWISNCRDWETSWYMVDMGDHFMESLEDVTEGEVYQGVWFKETLSVSEDRIGHSWQFYSDNTCQTTHELATVLTLVFDGGAWDDAILSEQELISSSGYEFRLYETESSHLKFLPLRDKTVFLGLYEANNQLYFVTTSNNTLIESFDGHEYQVDFNRMWVRQ